MRALLLATALIAPLQACAQAPADELAPAQGEAPIAIGCITAPELTAAAELEGVSHLEIASGPSAEIFAAFIAGKIGKQPAGAGAWLILWRPGGSFANAYYFDPAGCRRGYVRGPQAEILAAAQGEPS